MDPRGTRQAVQQLFVRETDRVRGYIFGLIPDFHASDDILQEVFLAVTESADDFVPGTNFLAWVRAIARHRVLRHLRDRGRGGRVLSEDVLELLSSSAPDVDDEFEDHRAALNACLEKMPPRAREYLHLRYAESLSPKQMSRRLGIGSASIRVSLARARAALRRCAERQFAHGGG
jgi:RNA polymerase sigma-70 factor (ECF subfamily)